VFSTLCLLRVACALKVPKCNPQATPQLIIPLANLVMP
jgi:hypothetical protein